MLSKTASERRRYANAIKELERLRAERAAQQEQEGVSAPAMPQNGFEFTNYLNSNDDALETGEPR